MHKRKLRPDEVKDLSRATQLVSSRGGLCPVCSPSLRWSPAWQLLPLCLEERIAEGAAAGGSSAESCFTEDNY